MIKCLVMFSGGLDSTIAVHLLKSQGIDVKALHFVLPFDSGMGRTHEAIRHRADALGIPIRIEEEGGEFIDMVRSPQFGYGKNANPCIDCRIHRLQKAARIMREEGAHFIATGEVVGQRPMSQHLHALRAIEKRCGLEGYLLRPLCAHILAPTIPEEKGWVDRGRLLKISGRGRKPQLAYAAEHGLSFSAPAGGCLLTHAATAVRFNELRCVDPAFALIDFKLLAYGRHFRLPSGAKFVVGRNDEDNGSLEKLVSSGDGVFTMATMEGPLGLLRCSVIEEDVVLSAQILSRFSKAKDSSQAVVLLVRDGTSRELRVQPFTEEECERFRITVGK